MGKADILEKGIRDYLAGDYERPVGEVYRADGVLSKHDKCTHDRWMYEDCEGCIDAHFLSVLALAENQTPTP